MSQNAAIFILTAVGTWNLAIFNQHK
jgi:hypothetical protein